MFAATSGIITRHFYTFDEVWQLNLFRVWQIIPLLLLHVNACCSDSLCCVFGQQCFTGGFAAFATFSVTTPVQPAVVASAVLIF
jgi:hypothetical protein